MRFFLSRLARAARRGEIEIHGFALLRNHFHLLLRSPAGKLSAALRRSEADHARRFNHARERRGPLFQGRFYSGRVPDVVRPLVLRYIDDNPVRAGMAASSLDYPACSAHWHAKGAGAPWLARGWVDAVLADEGAPDRRAAYQQAFPTDVEPYLRDWIWRRQSRSGERRDDLAALLQAPDGVISAWIRERAELADGAADLSPLLPWDLFVEVATESGAPVEMIPGLGSVACGLTIHEIAARLDRPRATTGHQVTRHRRRAVEDDPYATLSAEIVRTTLERLRAVIRAPLRTE